MNTHAKGYVGEQTVKLRAISFGWNVAVPEIEARYDLILDDKSRLYRVQVKYADYFVGNALRVSLHKECRNNGKVKKYTCLEIDAIVLYVPKTDKIYWIPASVFENKSEVSLRMKPATNGQKKGVRFLSDFEWAASIEVMQ